MKSLLSRRRMVVRRLKRLAASPRWIGQRLDVYAAQPDLCRTRSGYGVGGDLWHSGPEGEFNGRLSHGMVFGMATTKITITLENRQLEEIRALVAAGTAASVSAFAKHAIGVALFDAAGWREMLEDALQQSGGPLTKKERAWADAILSPRQQKRVSRKGKAA